eukprot:gene8356-biopygen22621
MGLSCLQPVARSSQNATGGTPRCACLGSAERKGNLSALSGEGGADAGLRAAPGCSGIFFDPKGVFRTFEAQRPRRKENFRTHLNVGRGGVRPPTPYLGRFSWQICPYHGPHHEETIWVVYGADLHRL